MRRRSRTDGRDEGTSSNAQIQNDVEGLLGANPSSRVSQNNVANQQIVAKTTNDSVNIEMVNFNSSAVCGAQINSKLRSSNRQKQNKKVDSVINHRCDNKKGDVVEVINPIMNLQENERELNIIGDDILVSVNASEDEFQSEDDDTFVLNEVLLAECETERANEQVVDLVDSQPQPQPQHAVSDEDRRYQEIQRIKGDPIFKELVSQAVAEQMKLASAQKVTEENQQGRQGNFANVNLNRNVGHNSKSRRSPVRNSMGNDFVQKNVKSPSDTTIYVPGLRQSPMAHEGTRRLS